MALKALMLRKKIDQKTKELEALRSVDFSTREAELEKAITEAETEEEQATVNEEIEKFEAERTANSEKAAGLEKEIEDLEADLEKEERSQEVPPADSKEKREDNKVMEKRNKFGITAEMIREERTAEFLETIRTAVKEKRAITGGSLLIPEVFLGLIKENVPNYSKLYKHVYARSLSGEGKLTIMGSIPEAVWTACCKNINEIDLGFAEVTVDCNKVAAFFPVCNALLEDADIDLAAQIVEALSVAIGKALDKAILYGSGSGMPLGIYTRLAQTTEPDSYPTTGRTWVDLHSTNMLSIANSVTGTALFQTIMLDSVVMNNKYSLGNKVWVMNDKTLTYLRAQGVNVNSAGAVVSMINNSLPLVGGVIETLDFVPDYNIVGGYFDNYLLSERHGIAIESAPLTKFVEDETLFRGKARYDGVPVIAEAFMALAVNGAELSAATMASDTANVCEYITLNKTVVSVAARGTTTLSARLLSAAGYEVDGTVTWASSDTAKATVANGKITGVATGSAVITASCGNAVAVCNVTVTS